MAIDNTPPRLQLIITIAVITIISLVGIDFVLRSYYGYMDDDAKRRKLAPTTALDDQHQVEKAALTSANVDQSMAQLAKGSRTDIVKPNQSDDMGPMTGWSKLPKQPPVADHGAGGHDMHAAGDAGAPQGDAGAAPHPGPHGGDAGAPPKHDAGAPAPKGAPHK